MTCTDYEIDIDMIKTKDCRGGKFTLEKEQEHDFKSLRKYLDENGTALPEVAQYQDLVLIQNVR